MEMYILYTIMFIIGLLLGSFFTLAINRIPNKQNIVTKRSYCPNCNHKLGFFDLIPILSYIFLKGKCKYCKEKISSRYLVLELTSGCLMLLLAMSMNINANSLSNINIISLILGTIYISTLLIIGGIDRKTYSIQKGVMLFGLIAQTVYIIYLYILEANVYKYIIYLLVMLILIVEDTISAKKNKEANYAVQLLTLCVYIVMWAGEELAIFSIMIALIMTVIESITDKPKKSEGIIRNVPIASWLCFSSIALYIIESFLR